jgi:hypothetical protein
MSERLEQEMAALGRSVDRLAGHKVLRSHATTGRLLWFNFLRGLAFGLGSVLGATVLVSVAVYVLSQIDFVPVIGEWAKEIVRVVEGE